MSHKVNVAVLGSTGFVGIELLKILLKHPNVNINFLGCENSANQNISNLDKSFEKKKLPKLQFNNRFDPINSDVVFMCLPHGVSNKYAKYFFNKIKIIDLSADFRLDTINDYQKDYEGTHESSNLLNEFQYGLAEINNNKILNSSNIAVPGCYPTSILLPLIPLIKEKLIMTNNIIIDSKSGYSGAGKKFDTKNINNSGDLNFYNYSTNKHRHMTEIHQELCKFTNKKIDFLFNPHILPIFRGMMSTIYCNLEPNILKKDVESTLLNYYKNKLFINLLSEEEKKADFFLVKNTNKCFIKLYQNKKNSKLIIVSIIDNLIKGAAGQAIQCFNIMHNFDESTSLI